MTTRMRVTLLLLQAFAIAAGVAAGMAICNAAA